MMQKQKVHFLHHHPLQNHQNITSKTTSKTFSIGAPSSPSMCRVYVYLSLATPPRPPTYSLRSPSTTQLAPSTKAGFRKTEAMRLTCQAFNLEYSSKRPRPLQERGSGRTPIGLEERGSGLTPTVGLEEPPYHCRSRAKRPQASASPSAAARFQPRERTTPGHLPRPPSGQPLAAPASLEFFAVRTDC